MEDVNVSDRIIIFGCGGHARSIINVIKANGYKNEIVLIDNNANSNEIILDCMVLNTYNYQKGDKIIIAIGNNHERRDMYEHIRIFYGEDVFTSIISNKTAIGIKASIQKGCFVSYGVYIGPLCRIGKNSIINTGCIIEHEAQIGSHVHIAPGSVICGRTKIGNNVMCGAGSRVIDKITICDDVVLGAGCVVAKDILEKGIYVGIPARKIKE